jgi:AcrR family transcriptional regulator
MTDHDVSKGQSRAPDHPQSTADKIQAAGIALFAEKGVDGTSVRDIADRAGVNPSLISYHFGGKEGLYLRILERLGQERLGVIQRILQPPKDRTEFRTRLRMFLEELVEVHQTRPEFFAILMRFFERIDERGEQIFKDTFLQIFDRVIHFIEDGQKRGFVNSKFQAIHVASLLVGGINEVFRMRICHRLFLQKDYDDPVERHALTESIIEFAFHGILTD